MPMQKVEPREIFLSFYWPALGRSSFIQKFRSQDDDDLAAPIGYRISKKRAQMNFRFQHWISDYPNDQESDRNDAQSMTVQKRVAMSGHVEPFACRLSTLDQAAC
jgi:hypothetical protein